MILRLWGISQIRYLLAAYRIYKHPYTFYKKMHSLESDQGCAMFRSIRFKSLISSDLNLTLAALLGTLAPSDGIRSPVTGHGESFL